MANIHSCIGKDILKHKCIKFNKSTALKNLSAIRGRPSFMMFMEYLKLNGRNKWGCKTMANGYTLWLTRRPARELKREAMQQLLEQENERIRIERELIRRKEEEEDMCRELAEKEKKRLEKLERNEQRKMQNVVDVFCDTFPKISKKEFSKLESGHGKRTR